MQKSWRQTDDKTRRHLDIWNTIELLYEKNYTLEWFVLVVYCAQKNTVGHQNIRSLRTTNRRDKSSLWCFTLCIFMDTQSTCSKPIGLYCGFKQYDKIVLVKYIRQDTMRTINIYVSSRIFDPMYILLKDQQWISWDFVSYRECCNTQFLHTDDGLSVRDSVLDVWFAMGRPIDYILCCLNQSRS